MKKFSLIITTRERIELLGNLIDSIYETTSNKDDVELFVMVDDDDIPTISLVIEKIEKYKDFAIVLKSRKRSEFFHRDYINVAARDMAVGKYVISFNDDCKFETPMWDVLVWNKLEVYMRDKPDGIVYGFLDDSLTDRENRPFNGNYCCFPLISKKAIDVLGFMFDPEFLSWSADIAIAQVYNDIERVVDLTKELRINHICFHNETRERDHISHHVEDVNRKFRAPRANAFFHRDRKILMNYIRNFKAGNQ